VRPSYYLALATAIILIVAAGILLHANHLSARWDTYSAENRALASTLGLSNLALSSEARYTRHLSLADSFAAFQDVPCGLDFLPSGTFFTPAAHAGSPGGTVQGQ
jgi:hypothetical protein